MAASRDVLIIGGGIIGLTAAYELAKEGLSVQVTDRGEPGQEASRAGAGIVPPGNFEHAVSPLDRLRAYSANRFPDYCAELQNITGINCGYRVNGGIEYLDDPEVISLWRAEKIPFEQLAPGQWHLPGMAQVRNPWLLRALVAGCEARGVVITRQQVDSLICNHHKVTAVRFQNGITASAANIIIAAGAWSRPLLAGLNVHLPVHPVRGQIVLYRANPETLKPTLIAGKQYLVPRGDGLILAGSTEEPEAGFDNRNTAEGVTELRSFAERLVPDLKRATIEQTWAGLRPAIGGEEPVISELPGFDNAFVAVGHFRAGIQLSLGTAKLLADLVMKRGGLFEPDAFHLQRTPQERRKSAFRS